MVHYHLTNKNLSWAQVRGCRSTSPFAGGGKGGRGVAALLRVHTLILLVFISKYFLKALRQQGAGGAGLCLVITSISLLGAQHGVPVSQHRPSRACGV